MSIRLTPGLSPRFAATRLYFPDSNGLKTDKTAENQYRKALQGDKPSYDVKIYLHPNQEGMKRLAAEKKIGDPMTLQAIQGENANKVQHAIVVETLFSFYMMGRQKGTTVSKFAEQIQKILHVDGQLQKINIDENERKNILRFIRKFDLYA